MSLTQIIFPASSIQLGVKPELTDSDLPDPNAVTVDVVIQERESRRARVVQHPVENGSIIADHVALEPRVFTMSGIVSPTPTSQLGAITNVVGEIGSTLGLTEAAEEPHIAAYNALNTLFEARTLFDVVTKFKRYRNMVFQSFSRTRDRQTGNVLSFSADMVEVTLVSSETVKVDALKGKIDRGDKPTKPADASTSSKSTSVLKKLAKILPGG